MENQNSSFNGWGHVEIFGHSQAAGFITTEYFGSACMFRVDTPELPEREFVLEKPEYVADVWTPAGATVKRAASPARSRLLGVSSIFSLNPCTEELARKLIEQIYPRPLILLKMPDRPQLAEAAGGTPKIDPVCGLEVEISTVSSPWDDVLYYFCSPECKSEFEDAPEDYVGTPEHQS